MTPNAWALGSYDLMAYPFPSLVARYIGVDDLTSLAADLPRRTWQTDQQSPWHALFYGHFSGWREWYDEFVRKEVAPWLGEPCYYQAVPTFRVHLPGNTAVGEFHTDAQYHHPFGERNFWLPLTPASDTASVWVEDSVGKLRAIDAVPGQVAQFSAVTRLHGNRVNETDRSRVSFDFRLLPTRLLPEQEGPPTKHTHLRFVPGGYYAEEVVGCS